MRYLLKVFGGGEWWVGAYVCGGRGKWSGVGLWEW